jgi:TonB-dependent starch-binding outer membrane protein SusC
MLKLRHIHSRILLALSIIVLTTSMQVMGQTVRGTVTDATDGSTLPGVSISIKGTTQGTTTDVNGNYQINASPGATLVFSFTGMLPEEVLVGQQQVINVALVMDIAILQEIVVVGYGTVLRRDLTGSVASVGGEALQAIPVSSIEQALTGKLAGVQITTTEGSPDAEVRIRVRGGGSITGDNSPLYIVDGFPVESISDISPADIESIDVLKDASSTAIYGSRGANGVIIVTTKRGKEGRLNVRYDTYASYKQLARQLDVLAPYDYALWQYERALLANNINKYTNVFGNYQDIELYRDIPYNNWQDQTFGRTGNAFNHNLNISSGTDKTAFSFSFSNIDDKAIMQLSNFSRNNISFSLTNKPNNRVTLDLAFRYANTNIKGGGANEQAEYSSQDSRLKYAMIYPPFPVSGLTDESETDPDFNLYHPVVALSDNDRFQNRRTYNLNGSFAWEMVDNLRFKSDLGIDDFNSKDDRFYGRTTYYVKNVPSGDNQGLPAIRFDKLARQTFRNTNSLTYNFKDVLPRDHRLNLLVAQEYILRQQEQHETTVHGFPSAFSFSDAIRLSALPQAHSIDNYLFPDDIMLSFFGRANYDFKGRYLFSTTFRADGSSRFSEGNRWGYFPSAAFAWRLSDENFMNFTSNWLDDMKLRVSYGTAGNNNIPSGQLIQTLVVSSTTWVNNHPSYWSPIRTMANPDLTWETTITRNVGLDYTSLGGRLTGSFEGYVNNTKDLLILFPISGSGYLNQYRNMGETENRGIEAMLTWIAFDRRNFGLSVNGNIGFNRNKILSLGMMEDFGAASGWASTDIGNEYFVATGGSVGQMYGYKSAGRYEVDDFEGYINGVWVLKEGVVNSAPIVGTLRPGSMKLVNTTEGDNVVNLDDRVIIGDANPKHTGGFTLNTRLYSFDLMAGFNWSYGNDIYNANKIEYTSASQRPFGRNMLTTMESGQRWTNLLPDGTLSNDPEQLAQMNQNTTMWSPYMSRFVFTDWAVEDGSFLRLNTLTLGYTLPTNLMNRVKIQSLRFYVSGYNLFLWTNYSGFDPEVSTRRNTPLTPGVDYSAYPRSRSVVFGMNLSF